MQHWFLSAIRLKYNKHGIPGLFCGVLLLFAVNLSQLPAMAQSPFDTTPAFLDVDQAFSFYISLDSSENVTVHWTIAPGYYLYADKFSFKITEPDEVSGTLIPVMPAGTPHEDEFFGKTSVYYQQTRSTLRLPIDSPERFLLEIGFQGCAEAGLCYPPAVRHVEITQ
ncbi:MAG: protein-disulfide reductase DsbD family protein [Pseudohongiella sp.]|nr:protein-disulfide reductase DsbD family protein [Pseudohongiella sp.]MDO9520426.1 protein-disulfide reductase DsbD family protein [Pseudohongiella sp.]MDP2126565.1 protein-disulfide reductase DsbD family protein [Pseudohongiella sp.]